MSRKLLHRWTLDRLEEEVLFTCAVLKTDPDSADLLPLTEGWLASIDEARARERALRSLDAETRAARQVANDHLDDEVMELSWTLLNQVRRDRRHPRYIAFFPKSPSQLIDEPMSHEVARVKGWLADDKDAALDLHREALTRWANALEQALLEGAQVHFSRMSRTKAHRQLCDGLTLKRDRLHAALRERAVERGLPRAWADRFFLKARPAKVKAKAGVTAEGAVAAPVAA